MFDGSHLPFEENAAQTAKIKRLAAEFGADCEGEIGCVGGSEDGSVDIAMRCTSPEQARLFSERTGVDCLAIAIGNAYGFYKDAPELRFDILSEVDRLVEEAAKNARFVPISAY
jgi:fructose-bisphosphate aldolase class II